MRDIPVLWVTTKTFGCWFGLASTGTTEISLPQIAALPSTQQAKPDLLNFRGSSTFEAADFILSLH
jgi:hypothetical protein